MVLVPATMSLLGKANWWLPAWLDRALPHLTVEGSVSEGEARESEHHPSYDDASGVASEAEELVVR
jgi:RND superfamily putative drug exporter